MKRLLLSAFLFVMTLAVNAQTEEVIEVDGLYYAPMEESVYLVKNPDGTEYSGKITIPENVRLEDGTVLPVYPTIYCFENSNIEEIIFDIPPRSVIGEATIELICPLGNDNKLRRIQFNKLIDLKSEANIYWNLRTGNNPNCVYCYMRQDETENLVIVDKFNVYGADGKQLRPCLNIDGTNQMIFPDENNVFHLDKEWMYNGESCGVFRVNAEYNIKLYGADADGNIAGIITEPLLSQTGRTTVHGGLNYSFHYNSATVTGIAPDAILPSDLVIPEYVEYEGKDYPVFAIDMRAITGTETVETITLPSTMNYIDMDAFYIMPRLKRVDLSATQVTYLPWTFYNCENLEEVLLPETCKRYHTTFYGCPNMRYVEIPEGSNCYDLSYNSGLVDTEAEWLDSNTVRLTITHWGISNIGGGEAEHYPYKDWSYGYFNDDDEYIRVYNFIDGESDGDSFIFQRSDFYAPDSTNKQFAGNIIIGTHDDPEIVGAPQSNIYVTVYVPQPSAAGITDRVVEPSAGPVQFFNLQGIELDGNNLTPGLYIRREGSKATKVLVR